VHRVRIGVLGAARIVPSALVAPAKLVEGVDVVAVAARDPERARRFADKYAVPRTVDSYEALLEDPGVDAIYNPLPNGLHGRWTIAALRAGKHVLCEKPFTANATEAEAVREEAAGTGLVVMEAFHYRYHPLARRMREVVEDGTIGTVRHIETAFCIPMLRPGDIRWDLDLAGGATMDLGAYTVHQLRYLGGAEPQVIEATARLRSPGVDRWMRADVGYADGRTGRMTCSMLSANLPQIRTRVFGDRGDLSVLNPIAPHYFHRFRVTTKSGTTAERFSRRSTYAFQLDAFRDAVLHGAPVPTDPDDAVANMRVIDAVYAAAGLEPRVPTSS
jgi:predicted dehydrogenase